MIDREINHLSVLGADGAICSIVTSWDIAKAVAGDNTGFAEIMTQDVVCIPPEETLRDAARVMESRHISALPVVADGRVVGMPTSELLSNMAERS